MTMRPIPTQSLVVWLVRVSIMSLPLWWILGVEQIVWCSAFGVIAAGMVISHARRIVVVPTLIAMGIFLGCYVLSAFSIIEAPRYITYVRNLSTYISVALLLLILTNAIRRFSDAEAIVRTVVWTMTFAGFVAIVSTLGILNIQFTAPIGMVLPKSVTATNYGSRIVTRALSEESWIMGIGQYQRARGFFLYPTMLAPALGTTIPMAIYLRRWSKGLLRMSYNVAIVVLIAALLATTARGALGALIGGGGIWFLFRPTRKPNAIWVLMIVFVLAASAIVSVLLSPIDVGAAWESVYYARGEGSPTHRGMVYRETLESLRESILFGWGTERDLPNSNSPFPAGSHSSYLGTLYKQGVIGLIVYLIVWWQVWKCTLYRIPNGRNDEELTRSRDLLRYGQWVVLVAVLNGITEALDLDASTMTIMWTVLATMVAVRHLYRVEESSPELLTT
jgi:hypothetical protein